MARQSQQTQFEPDDRGYIAKNDDRTSDKHPSHKGKVTLTYETLKALNAQAKEEGSATLFFAVWPGQKKGMMTVKAEAPQAYRGGAANDNSRGRGGRDRDDGRISTTKGQRDRMAARQRDNDDDMDDEDIPF